MSLASQINLLATRIGNAFRDINHVKKRVKACTTANVTLTAPGTTFDGVTMSNGDRFLAAFQTTKSQNGVYVFNGSGSTATRDTDFDTTAEAVGAEVTVDQGTLYGGSKWVFPIKSTNTLGSTNVTPARMALAPAGGGISETYLPTRLQGQPANITDWNNPGDAGFYCSAGNATNAPASISGEWSGIMGYAQNYPFQMVFGNNDNGVQSLVYARSWNATGGAWGSWFQIGPSALSIKGGAEKTAAASATTGSVTLDASTASIFTVTPTGNITSLAITNPPASGTSCVIRLIVSQGATPRTIATPTGGVFMGAATPTQVANKVCIFDYETVDGGTTWYCSGVVQV